VVVDTGSGEPDHRPMNVLAHRTVVRSPALGLTTICLGFLMITVDATIVNVALGPIGHDLQASTSTLQWILNGYTLTLAALILLGGSLGDRYGRRRIFVAGNGLFTIASLLSAVAPNAELLVAARLVQGVGGALLTPGSLAMVESGFRPAGRA
jgi:MFS family permease